jgi:hypothetical protein
MALGQLLGVRVASEPRSVPAGKPVVFLACHAGIALHLQALPVRLVRRCANGAPLEKPNERTQCAIGF